MKRTRPFARLSTPVLLIPVQLIPALLILSLLALALGTAPVRAERLKDLASVEGVRVNQLIGYGLVVGLDGSGDQTTQTPFTVQSVQSMLSQLGVNLPPGTNLQIKNVAAVTVTAALPAFAQPGQAVDVVVSSVGNAKSLRGGTLLLTPLKGADGNVYAMAQGNVVVGGAGAQAGGSSAQINHLAAGRVPAGATVERSVANALGADGQVRLSLNEGDFSTASRVVDAINAAFGAGTAAAEDARVIRVRAPGDASARVAFLGRLEGLNVTPAAASPKVILNARTGSVVMNQAVQVAACAIAHGNLTVTIGREPFVSQPPALSGGSTVVGERTDVEIGVEQGGLINLPDSASLSKVVDALNAVGATPQDLLAILQAMKAAGALKAELDVI